MNEKEIITKFIFVTGNNRNKWFFQTGDWTVLFKDCLESSELYIGQKFTHNGDEYEIKNFMYGFAQSLPNYYSNEDNIDKYVGRQIASTLDFFINCVKL